MAQSHLDQTHDSDPTAAEIFRVFRDTIRASIEGLALLLRECADLRADLITVHGLHSNGEADGVFSVRQQNRISELQAAANEMEALQASLSRQQGDGEADREAI